MESYSSDSELDLGAMSALGANPGKCKHFWNWLKGKMQHSYFKNVKDIGLSIPVNTLFFALAKLKWPVATNVLNGIALGVYNIEGITATQKHKPIKMRYYITWGCVVLANLASLAGSMVWDHFDPGTLGSCFLAGSSVCLVLTARKIIVCLVKKEEKQRARQHQNVLDVRCDDSDSYESDSTEGYTNRNGRSSTSNIVNSLIISDESSSNKIEEEDNNKSSSGMEESLGHQNLSSTVSTESKTEQPQLQQSKSSDEKKVSEEEYGSSSESKEFSDSLNFSQ